MAGEIVVGYDGADGAEAALREAIALCRDVGAELVVVFGYMPPGVVERQSADHRDMLREIGERNVNAAVERATAEGVTAHPQLVLQHAPEALVETAEEHNARMIVVGYHGEGPLKGALLGRTPYKVLHLASCPVLVARA
jgi:nucleotide-binding universal stress UspA family protein